MEILLDFYKSVAKKKFMYENSFISTCEALGLVIYEQQECKRIIGITEQGEWFVQTDISYQLLKEIKPLYKILNILEIPFDKIEMDMIKRFGDLMQKYDIRIIFPFYRIVEYTFSNAQSPYWIELAYSWYIMLNDEQKNNLSFFLTQIVENKKLPQQFRHQIRKEISRSKKYF